MKIIYAPQNVENFDNTLFLAGSIDMNFAVNWQQEIAEKLADTDYVLLNPRRLDWDGSWENTINEAAFVQQVTWELDCLEKAKQIVMYFAPTSLSPISLLELGLFADSKKIWVCCPEGFWRKGNVDIVCQRHQIRQFVGLDELIEALKNQ